MIDFMILYEIATRELDNILILGNELKRRGYSVEYMQFDVVSQNNYFANNRMLKKYRNNVKVLLVPSFYHNNEMLEFFYYPFGRVEKIVNLRWEQYYVNEVMDNPKKHLYLYPCESGRNAYHVCWGDVSHQNMIDSGIAEDRLLDTGPLHMDILRNEFQDSFKNKSELLSQYNLDSNKQLILFISSFANATNKSSTHRYLEKFFSGNYRIDTSRIMLEQSSYDLALRWFDDFLRGHNDVIFIYRPHPSEFVTDRLQILETKFKHFKVIKDYSVKQWILASDTLITWMSTSIIEAYFAGKSCYIIRPMDFPAEKDMCIFKGARFISDEDDFLSITNKFCEQSLSDEYIHHCYDVQVDNPSYVRLSDELEKIIKNQDVFFWDNKLIKKFERSKPLLIIKCFGGVVKSKAKEIIIGLLLSLKKYTKISFGQKIDEKLRIRKLNN